MDTTTQRPASVAPQDEQPGAVAESVAGLAGIIWLAICGLADLTGWLIVQSGRLLHRTTVGGWRHIAAPLWVLAAAAASAWWQPASIAWYWLILAFAADLGTWRKKARWLSARELILVARTFAGIALFLSAAPSSGLPAVASAALLATGVIGAGIPWWRWRVRPSKRGMLKRWENEVVAKDKRFAGTWREFDEFTGSGILRLHNAPSSEVAKLDALAELHLDALAGAVTIVDDMRLSRREVRVTFSSPGESAEIHYWDGSTLGNDGQFLAARAKGQQAVRGCQWRKDGMSHISIVGPTGSGKGSIQRIVGVESALHPDVFTVMVDGKRGKGLGYMQAGADVFARTPAQWLAAVEMVLAELERRSELGGADSFVLLPGRPRIRLLIDDLPEVLAAHPKIAPMLKRIAAQGRSLGIGLCVAMQQGDATGYGSTGLRANIMDGGWVWAGPATDNQAKIAVSQGISFDPTTLPPEQGWCALFGRHLKDQPVTPARTLWIPNRVDVEEFGMAAPFGTVEDWLERDTIHPEICPEMAMIFGLIAVAVEETAEEEPAVKPVDQSAAPVATLPRPALLPTPSAEETAAWPRIVRLLRERPDLQRKVIAAEVGVSERRVSQLFAAHKDEVVQNQDRSWRLAS
jgi:hypothetical protein